MNPEQTPSEQNNDSLTTGYHRMMVRVKQALETPTTLSLREHIERAQVRAVELGELSEEEAERISEYLRRDLEHAAHFISDTGQGLADWLRFDLAFLEDRILEMFSVMVDQTQMELQNIAERARYATEWLSGEITGPGTLACNSCGEHLVFAQPDYIPPCPKCGSILFKRSVVLTDAASADE